MAITPPATVQGWPKSLTWNLFRKVKSPPIPFKVAFTKYAIKPVYTPGWGTGTTGILKEHRLLNLSVLIQLDTNGCWVLDGKDTPQYLQHEQGHYDIGGLIARDRS